MAFIYSKPTEKTLVLAPREGLLRKLNFGTDWTEVRIGMFVSAVSAAGGGNVPNVAETLAHSTIIDFFSFGLKDDSLSLPGQVGATFLGLVDGNTTAGSSVGSGIGGAGVWKAAGYLGTAGVLSTSTSGEGLLDMGAAVASGSTAYCGFFVIRIVIANRGLATQTVDVRARATANVAGNDYSAAALRTLINNTTYGSTAHTIAWNDGVSAKAIPDCVWLRSPLYDNALRISAIRAIRYAP